MSTLSPTAQWPDGDFEPLLHCERGNGFHTADSQRATFEKMLAEWNIDKKRVHVVLRERPEYDQSTGRWQLPQAPGTYTAVSGELRDCSLSALWQRAGE